MTKNIRTHIHSPPSHTIHVDKVSTKNSNQQMNTDRVSNTIIKK